MKNRNELKLAILFLTLYGLLLNPLILSTLIPTENRFKPEGLLKLSDSDIDIFSPENKTYREGMQGYYPATYGFIDDNDNSVPVDWQDLSTGSNNFRIIPDKFGHQKVLRGIDVGTGIVSHARNYFNNTQGTIEFWWAVDSVATTSSYAVYLRDSIDASLFGIWVHGGNILLYTVDGWVDMGDLSMEVNTWNHVRLDFRSNNGNSYEGLLTDEFKLYYNEVEKGTYTFNVTGDPNYLMIYSGYASVGEAFFDAFGYSWDPNYNVGDNLKKGLLLSHSSETLLDWFGYSLNNQNNITLSGNKTIPIPADGVHTIQIFGNDSIGDDFYSDLRYFTIDTTPYIDLVTPEFKLYTEPMSGYYYGTYGFEDDPNDFLPRDWNDYSGAHPIDTRVISEFNGHKKVVRGYDGGTGAFNLQNIINKTYGTVEWWWALNDVSAKSIQMIFIDSDTNIICGTMMDSSNLRIWNNTGWITNTSIITSDNTWYHCRIDFEQTSGGYNGLDQGEYRVYFNGTSCGTFLSANLNETHYIRFYSGYAESGVYGYLDGVGYSWDPNYHVGDNLKEGLHIGFETNIELDWIGYSLDNQNNVSIYGNRTIPMLADGVHNIQIFGKNDLGETFSSELRIFIINDDSIIDLLTMEITAQSFSTEEFNITFYISNIFGYDIDDAIINIWWNNTDVSSNIQNLGNGFYFISLAPITVAPGEAPIKLNMTISAQGYLDKDFEIKLAVDPETLEKTPRSPSERFPVEVVLIIAASIIGIAAIIVIFIRRRK